MLAPPRKHAVGGHTVAAVTRSSNTNAPTSNGLEFAPRASRVRPAESSTRRFFAPHEWNRRPRPSRADQNANANTYTAPSTRRPMSLANRSGTPRETHLRRPGARRAGRAGIGSACAPLRSIYLLSTTSVVFPENWLLALKPWKLKFRAPAASTITWAKTFSGLLVRM